MHPACVCSVEGREYGETTNDGDWLCSLNIMSSTSEQHHASWMDIIQQASCHLSGHASYYWCYLMLWQDNRDSNI